MDGHPKTAKHGFMHTHIEHFHDGSGTMHHVHHKGPEHDVEHAVANLEEMHQSMHDNLGGEAEPAMPAAAAPAATPSPTANAME